MHLGSPVRLRNMNLNGRGHIYLAILFIAGADLSASILPDGQPIWMALM